MLVVADSSPLNILIRVGCVDVLAKLFGRVLIPPEVRAELLDARTPEDVRAFFDRPPEWLEVRAAEHVASIPPLDRGEEAAIALAIEARADALLIDEKDGRRAATQRGVAIVGTLGVLEQAAARGLIDLPKAFASLARTDFRVDPRLMKDALERHAQRRPKS